MNTIPRVGALSVAEFNEQFLSKGTPVVFQRIAGDWPAVQQWTIASVAEKLDGLSAPVKFLTRDDDSDDVGEYRELPLREFLLDVAAGNSTKPVGRYLCDHRILERNQPVSAIGQILAADLGTIPYIPTSSYGNTSIFVGADVATGIHFHHRSEAFLVMLTGRKSVVMVDPRDSRLLEKTKRSVFNRASTQFKHSERDFYKLCDASWAQRVDLEPGDMLYIPLHWWHYVFADEKHISLTYWFPAQWRHWKLTRLLGPSLWEVLLSKRPMKLGLYSRLRRRTRAAPTS